METPESLLGAFGLLNLSSAVVLLMYIFYSFHSYIVADDNLIERATNLFLQNIHEGYTFGASMFDSSKIRPLIFSFVFFGP